MAGQKYREYAEPLTGLTGLLADGWKVKLTHVESGDRVEATGNTKEEARQRAYQKMRELGH